MTTEKELQIFINKNAAEVMPDSDRYKYRFKVRSESSNSLYMISFDNAPGSGYWTCSCRGNISKGQCKHLTAMGLKGRMYGSTTLEASLKNRIS